MKTKLFVLGIHVFKLILNLIYCFFKLFPVQTNKVLFCSRQMDNLPLDFKLLQEMLDEKHGSLVYVSLCKRIGPGLKGKCGYAIVMLKSMYHLATSPVCVIDSYWPAVSLLKHKPQLKVIQIWHAIGKIKQSGHAATGKKLGRSNAMARALDMHKNYDYIIAGGKAWNRFYCESFNVDEDKLLNFGLPRIDYLINTEEKNKERFCAEYPHLSGKKIVLYAPTFRRNMTTQWRTLAKSFDLNDAVVIIKTHPNEMGGEPVIRDNVLYLPEWKTMDLIAVCDEVITDYSAIALEAAILKRPTWYWTYDYDHYLEHNGMNINLKKEVGCHVYEDFNELMKAMKEGNYNTDVLEEYRNKYLPENPGTSTTQITQLILDLLNR